MFAKEIKEQWQPLVLKVSILQMGFASAIFLTKANWLASKPPLSQWTLLIAWTWYWLPAVGMMLAETYWWLSSLISHGLKHHSLASFSCWDDSSRNTIFKRKKGKKGQMLINHSHLLTQNTLMFSKQSDAELILKDIWCQMRLILEGKICQ